MVQKPLQCDMAMHQVKCKSEKTKNKMIRQMIHACLQNALQFRFVLMGNWFASEIVRMPKSMSAVERVFWIALWLQSV